MIIHLYSKLPWSLLVYCSLDVQFPTQHILLINDLPDQHYHHLLHWHHFHLHLLPCHHNDFLGVRVRVRVRVGLGLGFYPW